MEKNKNLIYIVLAFVAGLLLMYLFNNYKIEKKNNTENTEISYQKSENQNNNNSYSYEKKSKKNQDNFEERKSDFSDENNTSNNNIDELTNDELVVKYLKEHGELPDYYITKSEAKSKGWIPSKGNLCDVLKGKAIGGDKFSNREKQLPKGEQYYEADVNYNCGNRGADRIVFTKNGEVWLTKNHYKSFERK